MGKTNEKSVGSIRAETVNIIHSNKPQSKGNQSKMAKNKSVSKRKYITVNRSIRPVKKTGEMISVKGKSFLGNIKANANKNLLKTLVWGGVGATLYPLVPTALQAVTENDWSGYKGLWTGVAVASILGLATGKPEITVGAMSACCTHLLYAKGTRMVESTLGTQIFRMNNDNVVYVEDLQKLAQSSQLSDEQQPANYESVNENYDFYDKNPVVNNNNNNDDDDVNDNSEIANSNIINSLEAGNNEQKASKKELTIGELLSQNVQLPEHTATVNKHPVANENLTIINKQTAENEPTVSNLSDSLHNKNRRFNKKYYNY